MLLLILLAAWQPDAVALIPLYRRNAALALERHGEAHDRTRQAHQDLAHYLARNGRGEEAGPILERWASRPEDFALLAEVRPARAREHFARALQLEETAGNAARVALRLNDLALVSPPAEAEGLLRRALALNEKLRGPTHPETAVTLHNLADVLLRLRRPAVALPLALRAAAIFRASLGAENDRTRVAEDTVQELQRALAASGRKGSPPRR
jgi:tetratricopeptide (TPR) repeat protein